MGRLMSVLTAPNNIHESNPTYNFKFPTSTSNNFHDNYFFGGYKCKKNNKDALLFEADKVLDNFDLSNIMPSLSLSFKNEVKPITFNAYSHKNSFKIIQSDKIKLQFLYDADFPCKIDLFYCALEKFSNGLLTYTVDEGTGYKFSSVHAPGPNKLYEHEFNNLGNGSSFDILNENSDFIPFVVLLSTCEESAKDVQQFVTHLTFDSRSENQLMANTQVTAQKLVYNQTCFFILEMYGADPFPEAEQMQNSSGKSSSKSSINDLKESFITLESNHSSSRPTINTKRPLHIQDCVICMASVRDTLVLPCRHLCLCGPCGDKLLHQSPACPICRSTFRALLQIENLEKYLINNFAE